MSEYMQHSQVQTGWDPAGDAGPDCESCEREYTGDQCSREDCPAVVARDGTAQARILLAHQMQDYDPALIPTCWWCSGGLDLLQGEVVCVNKECYAGAVAGIDWDEEPEQCSYRLFHGSKDPDSGYFGPDEYCEDYGLPAGGLCPAHTAAADRW